MVAKVFELIKILTMNSEDNKDWVSLSDENEDQIKDVIIQMVRPNSFIYDKYDENYKFTAK